MMSLLDGAALWGLRYEAAPTLAVRPPSSTWDISKPVIRPFRVIMSLAGAHGMKVAGLWRPKDVRMPLSDV